MCICILVFLFLNFIDVVILWNGIVLCFIIVIDFEYVEIKNYISLWKCI